MKKRNYKEIVVNIQKEKVEKFGTHNEERRLAEFNTNGTGNGSRRKQWGTLLIILSQCLDK